MRTRTDTSGLKAKLRNVALGMDRADRELAMSQAAAFVRFTQQAAPRDTNRYVRAWAMAGNDAQVGNFPVRAVVDSRALPWLKDRLDYQVMHFEKLVAWWQGIIDRRYNDTGRQGKWRRDAERKLRSAEKRLARAVEEREKLEAAKGGLVIWRSSKRGLTATVRDKVYGGTGSTMKFGGADGARWLVKLHNMEPHASIVEKQHRVVARGREKIRANGANAYGKRYLEEIRRAARSGGNVMASRPR